MNLLELQRIRETKGLPLQKLLPEFNVLFKSNTNKDIQGQLQSLVIDGKIDPKSNFYKFTQSLLNDI